jgi:hypothetical protein
MILEKFKIPLPNTIQSLRDDTYQRDGHIDNSFYMMNLTYRLTCNLLVTTHVISICSRLLE